MKIDVQNGVMTIIGQTKAGVVCSITGIMTYGDVTDLINCFGKNCIHMRSESGNETIIFEYNLRGEIRNPQKLLKSLRSKLMRVLNTLQQQVNQEACDLDFAMDMAATHGRGPAYR